MRISLLPMRMDTRLEVEVKGETLILNGEAVDLSGAKKSKPLVPEAGAPWIIGEVTRGADGLALTLLMPHGASAPDETRFPSDILVVSDGVLSLPPYEDPDTGPKVAFDALDPEAGNLPPIG